MKNICTLSDINYIHFGIALIESLRQHMKEEFCLYYLCLDDKIYNKMAEINFSGVTLIHLNQLMESDDGLKGYKTREYKEFVWMLASYFSEYILRTREVDSILYIDSDICFYDNPKMFYDEVGDKSVGIIRHRHIPIGVENRDGKYNVGLVYFKNDEVGKSCAYWWKDAVMNRKHPQYSTCYDQKYLEGFLVYFDKKDICIVDETFAHGAPWHYRLYDWSDFRNNVIIWQGKRQPFLFNHFSRMQCDLKNNLYTYCGNWYKDHTENNLIFNLAQIRKLYDDYFFKLKDISEKYGL
jgi:hypothetical protein